MRPCFLLSVGTYGGYCRYGTYHCTVTDSGTVPWQVSRIRTARYYIFWIWFYVSKWPGDSYYYIVYSGFCEFICDKYPHLNPFHSETNSADLFSGVLDLQGFLVRLFMEQIFGV